TSALRCQAACVEDCGLAGITSEGDEPVSGVPRNVDADDFFVHSPAHADGTPRPRQIRGMLHSAPRRGLAARVRIVPSGRHVVFGIHLGKYWAFKRKQEKKRQPFHGSSTYMPTKHRSIAASPPGGGGSKSPQKDAQ